MDMNRETIFSPDRAYRYTLWRSWASDNDKYVMFIGLNPSTADETVDDPTIRRCIGFAKRWGYGAMCMTNLFAFRATDPKVMKMAESPVGLDNDYWIKTIAKSADLVVVAWGAHGRYLGRNRAVSMLLYEHWIPAKCLGYTRQFCPRHPLYLKSEQKLLQYGVV